MFLFQPTGSGKFESLGSGTSDNKVNKELDKPKHRAQETKQSGKKEILLFIRIVPPVSGEARKNYFLKK